MLYLIKQINNFSVCKLSVIDIHTYIYYFEEKIHNFNTFIIFPYYLTVTDQDNLSIIIIFVSEVFC